MERNPTPVWIAPVYARRLRLLLTLLSVAAFSACQNFKNIWDITEPSVTPGWVRFRPEANIDPRTVFKDYANLFQLPPGNEMIIVTEEKDELGMMHYRYKQFFKQIPVENAEFLVHAKDNRAVTANGALAANFSPAEITPRVSEEQAQKVARERLPADRYLREESLLADLEKGAPASDAGYRPAGKLMFAQKPHSDSQEWLLAWVFRLYVLPLERSRELYISAADGSLIKEVQLFGNCASGSGDTTFRGNQQFNTKNTNSRFYLTNDCNGNELRGVLWDMSRKSVDVFDDNNNWNGNNRSTVTSYWALDIVYDYFRLVHNRTSYDNKNSNMSVFNDPNLTNAAFGGKGTITIGFGSTNSDNDDYNPIDIVGHEFGHSLIEASAQLGYDATKESAALNESFSDILGQMVERWEEQNQTPDWVIGDDKGCAGAAICRDLQNPKNFSQPDTYKGNFWQNTNIDPHVNGNVQNRWFYLVTDGGTGTNTETGAPYSIAGIGIQKSGKIVYRSLTKYLNAGSDYKDARAGSIRAAEDLYGIDSQEVGQVIKAWCAVGLCPYSQPKKPDIFDIAGGNPNPISPDNNNTLAGATPLGSGKYSWSTGEKNPQIKLTGLNIFPLNDIDYFKVTLPNIPQRFGGKCFRSGYSVSLTNNINANVYNNGAIVKKFSNASFLNIPSENINGGDMTIAISPAFPGQILDYDMQVVYYTSIDSDCYRDGPKQKWELLTECIMCNVGILSHGERVILEPPYRNKNKIPVQDYYFYQTGEANVAEIPIQISAGNRLRAQLIDNNGNVLAAADNVEKSAQGNILRLKTGRLSEGIYSLRFSDFGNGSEIAVRLPVGG